MTRALSQLLGAKEPEFHLRLQALEQRSGHPNADIAVSASIAQRVQDKIRDLGLDPQDTTAAELYHVLEQRLLADEQRLRAQLGVEGKASAQDLLAAAGQLVAKAKLPKACFALKTSVAKRLLQAQPPKRTMKALGYRSLPSMIKHEPVAALYAAAWLYETPQWRRAYLEQYHTLMPSDFETRTIAIVFPRSKRWELVAEDFASHFHHVSVGFKELGVVVLLPVSREVPALTLTTVLLMLEGINTIRCASTFLKLQQVRPDFGASVKQAAEGEPSVTTELTVLSDNSMPWSALQYYYHKVKEAYHPVLFEPHVQPEDLTLIEAEAVLAQTVPALEFWQDTADLALLQQGQVVSLNMLDVAVNASNTLAFEQRVMKYARQYISSDLLMHYLKRHRAHQQLLSLEEPLPSSTLAMEEINI